MNLLRHKLIFKLLILSVLTLSLFTINKSDLKACASFLVSEIMNDGSLKQVACFDDFNSAKNKMKENWDYVITNPSSASPSKIIAMNNGVAYTYGGRNNSETVNIYFHPYKNYNYPNAKSTYVSNYQELHYFDTLSFNNGHGEVYVNLNDFNGYVDIYEIDLVPTKYLVNDLPIMLGGKNILEPYETPYSIKPFRNYFTVEKNGNYEDLVYNYSSGYTTNKDRIPNLYSYHIAPAPSFMKEGVKYYSYNGYDFYEDPYFQFKVGTYYSYYQFLPARSKTNIKEETFNKILRSDNSKLKDTGSIFLKYQELYGINAALVYGIGINESNFGESGYARLRNNLFGINAVDSDPDKASVYSSVEESIKQMFWYTMESYSDWKDSRFYGNHLGNKGSGFNVSYASDPYWGMKAASFYYRLDKLDNNDNGNLSDFNNYELKLINTFDIPIRKEASDNAAIYYNSRFGPDYQQNFMVIKLADDLNNYSKIQLPNPVVAKEAKFVWDINENLHYDFNQSVGYIKNEYLSNVNYLDRTNNNETNEFNYKINKIQLENENLSVDGYAYYTNLNLKASDVKMQLILESDDKTVKFNLDPSFIGTMMVLNEEVDISDLNTSEYEIKLSIEFVNYPYLNKLLNINTNNISNDFNSANKLYHFSHSDDKLKLEIRNKANTQILNRAILNEFKFADNILTIDGLAFFSGVNFNNDDRISHHLVLKDLVSNELIEYPLNSYERKLNLYDGFNYSKIAYQGNIDLGNLNPSQYELYIKVSHNDVERMINLRSNDASLINIDDNINNIRFRAFTSLMKFNQVFINYLNDEYDYSKINKPSYRDSLVNLNQLNYDNKRLTLDGFGLIYYSNFSNNSNIKYNLIFINKEGKTITKDLKQYKCISDYTSILKSKYDMNNACFKGEVDLSDLDSNNYKLYLGITNDIYHDLIPLTNFAKTKLANDNKYHFSTNENTFQLVLEVK